MLKDGWGNEKTRKKPSKCAFLPTPLPQDFSPFRYRRRFFVGGLHELRAVNDDGAPTVKCIAIPIRWLALALPRVYCGGMFVGPVYVRVLFLSMLRAQSGVREPTSRTR